MARVFYFGFTQDFLLVLEVLAFLFWLKTKYFSLGKMPFENLFEICTMAFGIILCHFQHFSLAMALVQIHSPKPSLIFGSCFASNPASCTSPYNYFPFKSYSNKFLSSILAIGDLQRSYTFCFDFCPQTFFLPSLLNPQPRSMKIHWSSVQIFQTILAASLDQICQIWWNSFKSFS